MYGSTDHIPSATRNAGGAAAAAAFTALAEPRDASSSELPPSPPQSLYKVCGTRMGGAHAEILEKMAASETSQSEVTTLSIIPSARQITYRYVVVTHAGETVPTTIFDQICAQHMVLQEQFERPCTLPSATFIQQAHFKGNGESNVSIAALPVNLRDQADVVYATRAGTTPLNVNTIGNLSLGEYAAANFRLTGADGQPTEPIQMATPIDDKINVYILSFITDINGSGVNGVANLNHNTVFIDFDTLPLLEDGQPADNPYSDSGFPSSTLKFRGKVLCHEIGHALGLPHTFLETWQTFAGSGSTFITDVPVRASPDFEGNCRYKIPMPPLDEPGSTLDHTGVNHSGSSVPGVNLSDANIISDSIGGETYLVGAPSLEPDFAVKSHEYFYNVMDYVPDDKKLQFTAGQITRMFSITGAQLPKAAFLKAGPGDDTDRIRLTIPPLTVPTPGNYNVTSLIPIQIEIFTHFDDNLLLQVFKTDLVNPFMEEIILPIDRPESNPFFVDAQILANGSTTGFPILLRVRLENSSTIVSNEVTITLDPVSDLRPVFNLANLVRLTIHPVLPFSPADVVSVTELKTILKDYFDSDPYSAIWTNSYEVVPFTIVEDGETEPLFITAAAEIILFFSPAPDDDPTELVDGVITAIGNLLPNYNVVSQFDISRNIGLEDGIGNNLPCTGILTITPIHPTIEISSETELRSRMIKIFRNNIQGALFEIGIVQPIILPDGTIRCDYAYLPLNTAKTPDEIRSELIRFRDLQNVDLWFAADMDEYNGNLITIPTVRPGGFFHWEIKSVGVTFGRTTAPIIAVAPIDLGRRASAQFVFTVTATELFAVNFTNEGNRAALKRVMWGYHRTRNEDNSPISSVMSVIGSPNEQNYIIVGLSETSENLTFTDVSFYESFSGATSAEILALNAAMAEVQATFASTEWQAFFSDQYTITEENADYSNTFPPLASVAVSPLVTESDPDPEPTPDPDPDPDDDSSTWNRWWFWLIVAVLVVVLIVLMYWMFFGWARFW